MRPLGQLARSGALPDRHAIRDQVDSDAISLDGKRAIAFVNLGRTGNAYALIACRAKMNRSGLDRRAALNSEARPAVFGESSESHRKTGLSKMNPWAPAASATPNDTGAAVEALLIDGYRSMSPTQKLESVRALTQAVQSLALADIRRRHPHASEREQALRLASRWIEPELMLRAFGWDVREAGY